MDAEKLLSVLKAGGVVTVDGFEWFLAKAHSEDDMPEDLRHERPGEHEDELLDRQGAWWDEIYVCSSNNTNSAELIEALCILAGVRLRKP